MLKVVAYIRYSSILQDDGFSIEYQTAEINDYCEKNGFTLQKIYIDQAKTATEVAGRESFLDMLGAITTDQVDIVIVYKMNRMFRNAEESHVYRKKFRKHGVKIASITEAIDEETSAGRFMTNTLANLDQYQSESIADFVRSALREMTRQGYYIGGTLPLGYELQEEEHGKKLRKKYIINKSEAVHVKKCFELYAEGFTLRYIMEYLNSNGIVARRGKPIGTTTLRRLLENEMYIGTLKFVTEGYSDLIVPNAIPAIVDIDVWNRVQVRKKADKWTAPRQRREYYPLTGKIVCGCCGQHFFGISSKAIRKNGDVVLYNYYICSSKRTVAKCDAKQIRKEFIEQVAMDEVRKHFLSESVIDDISKQVSELSKENPHEIEKEIKRLKRHLVTLDERLDLFIDMREKKEMSGDTLRRKSAVVESEIIDAKAKIAKLEESRVNAISENDVKHYLSGMMQKLASTDSDIAKVIFDNFIESIILTDDKIFIRLFVCADFRFLYNKPNDQSNGKLYKNIEMYKKDRA